MPVADGAQAPAVAAALAALNLSAHARAAADELVRRHGAHVVFTSGRRGVAQQASAMAGNVVGDRSWIRKTYKDTPERALLQAWVTGNPQATTKAQLAQGLESVMRDWPPERLRRLSAHASGDAFDVQPVGGPLGQSIKKSMSELPHLDKVLFEEGGKVIWHAQFS